MLFRPRSYSDPTKCSTTQDGDFSPNSIYNNQYILDWGFVELTECSVENKNLNTFTRVNKSSF